RIDDFAIVANDVATPPQTPDDTSVMRPIDEAWDGVDADDESVVAFSGFRVDSIQNEGASVRLAELDALPPQSVTVRGKIWARSFERVVTIDDALARRLPAYAVGDESLRGQLSDDELRTVSFVSGAVSPVTSYLAAPQNAAPSVIGLELMPERGGLGMRGIGCGGCGTSSRCGLRVGRVRINLLETLRVLLEPGVAACEAQFGARGGAKLSLEATADEVVDARATGGSDAMNACLVEAAWAVRLTDVFEHHRTYDIEL
ncbi:MAG: hypothetical protein JNM17_38495, partial [Archangium sp.]|nr:hypothetical protein [Archangium sp.]